MHLYYVFSVLIGMVIGWGANEYGKHLYYDAPARKSMLLVTIGLPCLAGLATGIFSRAGVSGLSLLLPSIYVALFMSLTGLSYLLLRRRN